MVRRVSRLTPAHPPVPDCAAPTLSARSASRRAIFPMNTIRRILPRPRPTVEEGRNVVAAQRMHDNEVEIDSALVRRLLASQFPQWKELKCHEVDSTGTTMPCFGSDARWSSAYLEYRVPKPRSKKSSSGFPHPQGHRCPRRRRQGPPVRTEAKLSSIATQGRGLLSAACKRMIDAEAATTPSS
jgi:hypothetical protein